MDAVCGGGSGGGLRVGASGAGAVVVGVEAGEAEELLDVGGDVGADELFVLGEGYGYGREGEVVLLVGEGGGVELVADEGALGFGHGDVADVDAVVEGVGSAVGTAAGLGVEELIVPDEGDAVGGDAGVGFDGVDALVEAGLKGGKGVFGAETASAAVAFYVEFVCEAGGRGGALGGEGLLEEVGAVGDEAVGVEADDGAHGFGVVGGPGDDANAELLEGGYGNRSAEDGGVVGGEDRGEGTVLAGVGGGGLHEGEVRVWGLLGHGGEGEADGGSDLEGDLHTEDTMRVRLRDGQLETGTGNDKGQQQIPFGNDKQRA